MRRLSSPICSPMVAAVALLLSACAANPPAGGAGQGASAISAINKADIPFSSPECLAAQLRQGDPFPANAIPEAALAKRQSGWVAIRYDLRNGSAQNLAVVGSQPAGLYDAAALQHAAKYRDPGKPDVRGCVTTIEVAF